jgi:glycosyltransferase involved in cell wall biosynthesis
MPPKLSILIPAYNEENTIGEVLRKVADAPLEGGVSKEIIVVNDCSTDGTEKRILDFIKENPSTPIIYTRHEKNLGKGACVHSALSKVTGDYVLIQDADLEYDPRDYNALLQPVLEAKADVVFGSRFNVGKPHRILFFWHTIGNKFLSFLSNMLGNLNLTDMECGYKLFRTSTLRLITLQEKRFGFEPEVTAKIARLPGTRIYEIGVSYYGRTYADGKKINWQDGFRAIYCVLKYNLFSPLQSQVKKERSFSYLSCLPAIIFFLAGLLLVFFANGTADEGDSIMHYLFARTAFVYPAHFFDQWAKPVYVLVSAPFAQYGMTGIKLFNLVLSTLTILFTVRIAKKLDMPFGWSAALLLVFAPMFMIVTLSGLTEPLFAFWLITGTYGLMLGKRWVSITWLSFLPFVRSEGLIVLCVLLIYLFVKKYYKLLPLLVVGHVVYMIAGYKYFHDLLWVFNTLSYATWQSAYGSGSWKHFAENLPEVIGVPVCILFVLGLIYGLYAVAGKFLFRDREAMSDEELYLVYGSSLAVFVGHSAFWALGIFNSFGLLRVLVGVLPLMALISLRGLYLLFAIFKSRKLVYFFLALVLIFPFIHSKYSFRWKRDFNLKADQVAEMNAGNYLRQQFPGYKKYVFYYEPPYMSVALGMDYFDTSLHRRFLHAFEKNNFPPGAFLIWDDWFAPQEGHVELQNIQQDVRFEFLKSFEEKDYWGKKRDCLVFRVR